MNASLQDMRRRLDLVNHIQSCLLSRGFGPWGGEADDPSEPKKAELERRLRRILVDLGSPADGGE